MPDYDRGFKLVAHKAGRQLARVAGLRADTFMPLVSEMQMTERFADRAFKVRDGKNRFVLYMEAYTRWNRNAPWSILAKSGLLSEREHLPTLTMMFILLPRGYRPFDGEFTLAVYAEETQRVRFREVLMWQKEPEPWWEAVPALMPLYPLCDHGRRPREAIRHAAGVITERMEPGIDQADTLFVLNIFGKLVYPRLGVESIIGSEIMKESSFVREAREEGRLEARREDILAALEVRLGPEAARSFAAAINTIDDFGKLHSLFALAIRGVDLDEFRRALPVPTTRR